MHISPTLFLNDVSINLLREIEKGDLSFHRNIPYSKVVGGVGKSLNCYTNTFTSH